jgi:hypothetical protein
LYILCFSYGYVHFDFKFQYDSNGAETSFFFFWRGSTQAVVSGKPFLADRKNS